jgi:hypothetical protein
MGQPGKYVFCFASSAPSPIPSIAEVRGMEAGASAVTVIGASGTMEVLPRGPGDTPAMVLGPVAAAMHGARSAYNPDENRENSLHGEHFLLMPPELAMLLIGAEWDLSAAQEFILANSPPGADGKPWPLAAAPTDINIIPTGGVGIKMTYLVPWGGGSRAVTRPLLSLKAIRR